MKIQNPLQTLVRIGTLAFAFSTAVTAAADCDDETDIIGGGFFSASCSSGAVDGEAIGASNAATGSITAQVFALQLGPEAFGSLRDEDDIGLCFAQDTDATDGAPGDFSQSGPDCANAVVIRVAVTN